MIQNRLIQLKLDDAAAQYQQLMVKLAEDRFTLAVLGQFKRGKSSLMNAVVGRNLLPTGVLPLTSVVTVLRYGPIERLVLIHGDLSFPEELPASRLEEFVTERGNPGNAKRVKLARLEVPLPFLRQGLEFVDTPGVGSSIEANTATTYEFLPQCDAAIFVTSVDSPLSKMELEFLATVRQLVRRVFFVLNKIDLLNPDEQEDVLNFVHDSLADLSQDNRVVLFPISARQGLEAKQTGSREAYSDSGMRGLEEALAAFLAKEKAATFLDSVLDKAIGLLPSESATPGERVAATDFWQDMRNRLQGIKSKLERLPHETEDSQGGDREPDHGLIDVVTSTTVCAAPEIAPTKTALNLRTRGCPICDKLSGKMFDFFCKWQYALASEESAQRAFAVAGGFCPVHTWQLVALASPQGLSMGLPVLMDRLSRKLTELVSDEKIALSRYLLPRDVPCAACEFLISEEEAAIAQLVGIVRTEHGLASYRQSQGLCLHHLGLLLHEVDSDSLRADLLSTAARRCSEWAEDMQNYAMKRDALRRALLNEDEEDACYRAVIHLAGARALCLSSHEDDGI